MVTWHEWGCVWPHGFEPHLGKNVGFFKNIIYLAYLKHKYAYTGIVILHIKYLDRDNSVIEVHYTDIKSTTTWAKVGLEPMMSWSLMSSIRLCNSLHKYSPRLYIYSRGPRLPTIHPNPYSPPKPLEKAYTPSPPVHHNPYSSSQTPTVYHKPYSTPQPLK